ncbi:cyclic nucleotide-binding/CBS domain-containing protein [Streptomyces chrestomyceticus]|uniref:CBS domain-containing protein n=1 Tax=Streptomyces chrestomyceticus TaxID=68185 RepID=A0ABU7WWX6_9ACTN
MYVRNAMSTVVLTIGPAHTLRQAARLMAARRVGAAVVLDTDTSGLGILTERDILNSLGAGEDPDRETAQAHTTSDVVFAAPEWTLDEAATAMVHGGFRHLIVLDDLEPVGIVSVRDIIRCRASVPEQRAEQVSPVPA